MTVYMQVTSERYKAYWTIDEYLGNEFSGKIDRFLKMKIRKVNAGC